MTDNIVRVIKDCCIEISSLIRHGDSESLEHLTSTHNKTGDEVKKLDLISNEILKEKLIECDNIRLIGSEEEETLIKTPFENGRYLVCFDPLDGSSNIGVNITVGTIFAIYDLNKNKLNKNTVCGEDIVCAGYCLYGGSTQFIISHLDGTKMFTLHHHEFILSEPSIKIPSSGSIYSVNESNRHKFVDKQMNNLIDYFISHGKTARWVGSLVADGHRTLLKGGFFAYPGNNTHPNGKLRLLYEVLPFAFIFKISGGKSIPKLTQCVDLDKDIHQKISTVLSSSVEMVQYNKLLCQI